MFNSVVDYKNIVDYENIDYNENDIDNNDDSNESFKKNDSTQDPSENSSSMLDNCYSHIVNVTALEGKFNVGKKSGGHPHTVN